MPCLKKKKKIYYDKVLNRIFKCLKFNKINKNNCKKISNNQINIIQFYLVNPFYSINKKIIINNVTNV